MTVYRALRALGQLALRWFYRDIEVVGMERVPERGAALLASNHPNALVDALVIGCMLRRPITLTAKATLLDQPLTRALLHVVGVVPLRRASDTHDAGNLDPSRNTDAFSAVLDRLQQGGLVLLFPEGKSHSDPALAPLKTGLARIAVMARDERGLGSIPIIPIGLTFERKWEPRSRVLVHVGAPITVSDAPPNVPNVVAALTHRVEVSLRQVTLNFRTTHEAQRVLSTSTILTEVLDTFRPLNAPDPPLADNMKVAQRLSTIAPRLGTLEPTVEARVAQFLARLSQFESSLRQSDLTASDVQMNTGTAPGVWFAVRELAIAVVAGPLAVWGRMNHWLPLRIARTSALRVSRTPDEPAMNTIIAGLLVVFAFYVAQMSFVAWWLNRFIALVYVISLPLSASWDFQYADRLHRATARIRAYLRFREDPSFHQNLLDQISWLRNEAIQLNSMIDDVPVQGRDSTYHIAM